MNGSDATLADASVRGATVRGLAPLVAGFLLVAAIILAAGWLVLAQDRAEARLRQLLDTRSEIVDLLSSLQDAETGQRGYLLTGDDTYLAPYLAATESLPARVEAVARAVAEDPRRAADMPDLREAIADKLTEMRTTIAMHRAGRDEAAIARVREGTGKQLMDRVRVLVGALDLRTRQHILDQRSGSAVSATAVALAIVLAGAVLAALAAYVIADARRRTARLSRAYEEVRRTHGALVQANATRDRLAAQLVQAQKMEAMGQLTGGLAHDFNNMLAIIIGNLTMMKRRLERGEHRVERYADQALEGASRAATLTHRLLAFARKQPLAPAAIEPNRLVSGMSELLRRTLGEAVEIETVLAGGLWSTRADPHQLESALLNLAINARDAMPSGGRLTIETGNAHLDEAYVAENVGIAPGQYVMIAVSDTGTGMSREVAAKAFEPFFTTKEVGRGTGLGLSQVFGFVRQSGGHVKIYSEPGQGSAVKIYLPRLTGPAAAPDRPDGRPIALPEGRAEDVILVVEDEPSVRRLTVDALRDLNYTVIHADGGSTALQLLDDHPNVALLFTDVVMPAMNGRELAQAAQVRRPGLKVLYTTGYTRNAIVHNGVIDADVQLIGKPFTLEQLAVKISQAIADERPRP